MTWGRLDDKTATSPEWIGINDVALRRAAAAQPDQPYGVVRDTARQSAQRAKSVHLLALMWTVPAMTDGRITTAAAEQICSIGSLTMEEFEAGAGLLSAAGAWSENPPTEAEPFGSWSMMLGWRPGEQPTKEEEGHRQALNRLRNDLREGRKDFDKKVAATERSGGRCEYCDAQLGAAGGQIDHVDPLQLSNELANLAHVCASCNKRKGRHSLASVGMAFTTRAANARAAWDRASKRATRGATRSNTRAPQTSASRRKQTAHKQTAHKQTAPGTGRDGTGRVGSGEGEGVGPGRAGEAHE